MTALTALSALRIILIGQAAFAEKALETLVSHGEEIVHVFAPPDPPSGRPDPLKAKALEFGLPLSQPASFRGDAAFEHFKSLNADLAIMAFVTIIVPERILYAPRFKSICFHPSLLPPHRGGQGACYYAGRAAGDLRTDLPRRACEGRFQQARARGLQLDPGMRSAAGCFRVSRG